jgi:hypothetical protein
VWPPFFFDSNRFPQTRGPNVRILSSLVVALIVTSPHLYAAPATAVRPYHLRLEAYPAAPFPFLSRFGSMTVDLYPHGLRAETLWLNGFSTVGSKTVTVENPLSRSYSEVPIAEIATDLAGLSTYGSYLADAPVTTAPLKGTVRGTVATRYRFQYGPEAFLDLWTTNAFPENAQMRALATEIVRGIAPGTVPAFEKVGGTPLYIELNFRRFKKVVFLKMKSLTFDSTGEAGALKPGPLYFRAPSWDSIWK